MIVGFGIDLVVTERVRDIHKRFGVRFAQRLLAQPEWVDYQECADGARLLAKRFAAKEAAAKALGTGIANGIRFQDVWVEHEESGAPRLCCAGAAREQADRLGVSRMHVSLSDERDQVIACVILEASGS